MKIITKLKDFNSVKIQVSDEVHLPVTSTRELTPEGYLKATASITKIGVQMYSARDFGEDSDELVGVLRPAETVFHQETMDSIKLKPITILHPEQDVDSTNVSRLSIGTVGETVEALDSEHLGAAIQVTDEPIVKAILGREIDELSLGYDVFIIAETGDFNGQPYSYKMDGPMICNHLAVVPEGRCGDSVKILDTGESIMKKKYAVAALRDAGFPEEKIKLFMAGVSDDTEADMKAFTKLLMSRKDIDMTELIPSIVAELKPTIEEMVSSDEFKASLAREIALGMTGATQPTGDEEGGEGEEEIGDEELTPEMLDAKVKDAATVRAKLINDAKPLIDDESFDIFKASNRDITEKALLGLGFKAEDMKDHDDAYLAGMLTVVCKDRADAGTFMQQSFKGNDGVALAAPVTALGARKLNKG